MNGVGVGLVLRTVASRTPDASASTWSVRLAVQRVVERARQAMPLKVFSRPRCLGSPSASLGDWQAGPVRTKRADVSGSGERGWTAGLSGDRRTLGATRLWSAAGESWSVVSAWSALTVDRPARVTGCQATSSLGEWLGPTIAQILRQGGWQTRPPCIPSVPCPVLFLSCRSLPEQRPIRRSSDQPIFTRQGLVRS